MIKNAMSLGGASKLTALFQKMCPKKRTHAPIPRIGQARAKLSKKPSSLSYLRKTVT